MTPQGTRVSLKEIPLPAKPRNFEYRRKEKRTDSSGKEDFRMRLHFAILVQKVFRIELIRFFPHLGVVMQGISISEECGASWQRIPINSHGFVVGSCEA